jgi:dsDNA-specific endonuclease/ATPase MutS2
MEGPGRLLLTGLSRFSPPKTVDDEFPAEPIRIPVTDVIDLHTVAPRDIEGVVEEYLAEARRLGFRALRIIHGRGIGVQRETVRSVLARTAWVASFADAPAEAGGWGATVITLRRH